MRIIVDVMSGDNAPLELIKGAVLAADENPDCNISIVGDRETILRCAEDNRISVSGVDIIPSYSTIVMEDKALAVVREKKDSSMGIGLKMLQEGEGEAFVSAGNTGALIAGATLLVRRIKGISRAGIATILPFPTPVLLMDSGANLEVTPENHYQFAFMGSKYMEKIYSINRPRVGQLNNGTEHTKGLPLQTETYQILKDSELNFVGNIEGKEVPFGACDVLVCDGFTGNVLLKNTEGMGKFMMALLKDILTSNPVTILAALSIKKKIKTLKHQFDASEHGGAPLLGISKPVIKAHGSSDAKAVKNAVRQAIAFVKSGINDDIEQFCAENDAKKGFFKKILK